MSTLAVSMFYLIPQMVGAGVLVQPLLGLPHWVGVVLVGAVVIFIVVTAGMVSTTWVQFIKGSLLIVFSTVLTVLILNRGFHVGEHGGDSDSPIGLHSQQFVTRTDRTSQSGSTILPAKAMAGLPFLRTRMPHQSVWSIATAAMASFSTKLKPS